MWFPNEPLEGMFRLAASTLTIYKIPPTTSLAEANHCKLEPGFATFKRGSPMRLLLVGAVFLSMSTAPVRAAEKTYDVVIAGVGSGGVSAAIEAVRHGASVALLEETDWIGGQMTAAGVSTMDEHYLNVQSGIYWEFISRVQAYYAARGKSIATCYWSDRAHCFEPGVGQKILYAMIAEARKPGRTLDVMTRTRVERVLATGNRVEGVVTSSGATIRSKVLIDATEYGDVLPLVPGQYRIGKYTGNEADPNGCVQWITYTAVVKKYPNGVPEELRMKRPPPGYAEIREKFVRQLQANGNPVNRVLPVNWPIHNGYRGLPDSSSPESYTGREPEKITKTVLNWFNDYPVPISWFNRANRKKVNCEAKLKTLQLLYYVQHDLPEPLWSVANDEGYDTAYNREENLCENIPEEFKPIERQFPVMPYVRESRRMVGVYTLTAADIRREGVPPTAARTFASSIAVGDYPADLHGCSEESTLEFELERTADRPGAGTRGGLFQVPIEALIPRSTDGFLAAEKNISQTRLSNGATRLQPITMLTGQAAGLLAALAAESGNSPRRVSVGQVQKILLDEKSALSLAQFKDLPRDNPLWAAVQMVTVRGWMTGLDKENFGPGEPLKRRAAAAILAERADLHEFPPSRPRVWRSSPGVRASFEDVPLYDPDAGEIEMLWKMRAITACSEQPLKFCPDAPVTRAQFAEMFSKVLKRPVRELADANRPITRGEVAGLLASTAAEEQRPDAAQLSVQASYAGIYGAPGKPSLSVVFEDNRLFARAGDDPWFRLHPVSASEFFTTANATRWTFIKGPDGQVREVVARVGDVEIRRRRIP